jgi:pectin methylesterase-like acyl-CoA thioesterase
MNIKIIGTSLLFLSATLLQEARAQQIAFPGAEGAGRFASGGRGTSAVATTVFEVTNLNDDNNPGSLRYALTQPATYRTIVFRVSGTIRLTSKLTIRGNTTIAGQTAPGDGICIADHPVQISGDNVIVRYIRIRMGDRNQLKTSPANCGVPTPPFSAACMPLETSGGDDAFGNLGGNNIIIDHCSVGWSSDEALTIYRGDSLTLQWNIISEPLNYSYHFEGGADFQEHGYGGIWGAKRGSFHHNLIAHAKGRNPRFAGISTYTPATIGVENADFRNNVVYNWGSYSTNGGDGGNYNLVNNYYKYGPSTGTGNSVSIPVRGMIVQPSQTTGSSPIPFGKFWLSGNYVDGYGAITSNNWLGVSMSGATQADTTLAKATAEHSIAPMTTHSALEAYQLVLDHAGASFRRDTLDLRIVNDVKNRTGKLIDVQGGYPHGTAFANTVNAWPKLSTTTAPIDTDKDGMPDSWETSNGLNPNNAADRGLFASNGYTNLENYLNSIVTGTQSSSPIIFHAASLSAFAQTVGTPTASQSFTVSASNLTAALILTAPASFELSLNESSWSPTITINQTGGSIASTLVYIRMNASVAGGFSGNITGTSTGASDLSIPVSGLATQFASIGYFSNIDGGFERQTIGSFSTVTAHTSTTDWEVSAAWEITSGTARTGNRAMFYKQASTSNKYVFSPVLGNPSLQQNTDYVIQFWYKPMGTLTAATDLYGWSTVLGSLGGSNSTLSGKVTLDATTPAEWQLFTGTLKTTNSTPTSTFLGLRVTNPQAPFFQIDDFVAYPGTTADNAAPAAIEGLTTVSTSTSITLSWSAPSGGIDNGGYLIVRSLSSTAPTPNQKGVYIAGNTMGSGYEVIYAGTDRTFTDNTPVAGTTYHYHVFVADKAFNYSAVVSKSAATGTSTSPMVQLSGNFSAFSQTIGAPSSIQKITVIGSQLSGNLTVTVPAGFQASTDGTNWSTTLTMTPVSGSLQQEVSVRLNASAAGTYSGQFSVTGGGLSSAVAQSLSGTASTPAVTPTFDALVAKDGSGQYTSIQAAVNAAPAGRTTPWRIFIKKGKYVEAVIIPSNKPFLQLSGESMAETILSYDNYSGKANPAGGTFGTSTCGTLIINANDVMLMNLSIENATGYGINANAVVPAPGDGPQAVAVYTTSDRVVIYNCRMNGGQDTYYGGNVKGTRVYVKNSYIDGNTDFIFGSSTIIFDTCIIYPRTRLDNGSGGYVTATNTKAESAYGYVFRDCKLTQNRGTTFYTLGRPWQNDAGTADASKSRNKTVFLNSKMGASIKPEGWSTWDAGTNTSYITYAEYKTRNHSGSLKDVSGRVSWSKQLTDAEALKYYQNDTVFVNADVPAKAVWDPYQVWPELRKAHVPELSVSNLLARRPTATSTSVNVTWNLTWPMTGIRCELYRSADRQNYTLVDTQTSVEDSACNFNYVDQAPPAGVSHYYIVRLSKTGSVSTTSDTANVSSKPIINVVSAFNDFLQGIGQPSGVQSYAVSGLNIMDSIKIVVPSPYEASADNGITWKANGLPLGLQPVSGTVSVRNIWVRLNGSTAGNFPAVITHLSSLADTVRINLQGRIQTDPLPVSNMLIHWPLTRNNEDSAAVRATGVTATTPSFARMVVSNGTTVPDVPAYSGQRGQAFAATADGFWTTASGGPGGNLNRAIYAQYSISTTTGYKARIDSLILNTAFYASSSNTKLAIVYSLSGFVNDSTEVNGYSFASPKVLVQDNTGPSVNLRMPLNGSSGVQILNGQTLTIRLYYSCGSTSAGRYALLKDVIAKGLSVQDGATAIRTVVLPPGFSLFPNPAQSQVRLRHPRSVNGTRISVYNVEGMKVLDQPVRYAVTETRVDMPLLPRGQYLLSYQMKDERVIIPFILAN